MNAAYVFRVRFRLDPEGARVDPNEFETVLRIPADPPGEDGWLFFRDNLWRGEAGDERHLRDEAESLLSVPVSSVRFSELETDPEYLSALKRAIEDDIEGTDGTNSFNATTVDETLSKYLGSSIRVRESDRGE
ncbi:LWR-salt protein [Halobium salinum]|uniref:LWR-salt protein n=1 Tax=Halobium salinum TaxID=1364940 RepID=A0ABD5P980_9EURY|nr:LWR-salt protein [Halobium salinum]